MAKSKSVSQAARKPHAVIIPYPLQGHINPMMQLAKKLVSSGFIITFVNTKHNHMLMQEARPHKVEALSTQQDDLRFVWIADGLSPDFDYSNIRSCFPEFHNAVCNMRIPFEELIENLNETSTPVTCIIFGSFCPWTQDVAKKFNLPSVFFWTQSAAAFSIYYHVPKLISNGFFPYKASGRNGKSGEKQITYIPGIPPFHPEDLPTLLHVEDASHPRLQSVNGQFEVLGESDWIFINSYYDLEKEAFDALQREPHSIHAVGPLLPSAFLDGRDMKDTSVGASLLREKSECIQWLDKQPASSVIYVSFGSLIQPSCEQMQELALGLKASRQRFLWALRPNSTFEKVSDLLPENFLEDTKDQGMVIPWAPQLQVLSHPSVGGFLSHCGWNSTLESISIGVAMLPLHVFSDQPTNSRYIADMWKVGLDFRRQDDGIVKSEEVARVVRIVLQEEEGRAMRCRAVKLKDAARTAIQDGGSSDQQIQQFVQAMKQRVRKQEAIDGAVGCEEARAVLQERVA